MVCMCIYTATMLELPIHNGCTSVAIMFRPVSTDHCTILHLYSNYIHSSPFASPLLAISSRLCFSIFCSSRKELCLRKTLLSQRVALCQPTASGGARYPTLSPPASQTSWSSPAMVQTSSKTRRPWAPPQLDHPTSSSLGPPLVAISQWETSPTFCQTALTVLSIKREHLTHC